MARRPNFLLLLSDQQRQDSLSCYGNPICKTPNLDALAESGIRFDFAYTQTPVCSPSRASLLTGLYPHNHKVIVNTHIPPATVEGLNPSTPTFSRLLLDSGYRLGYFGKWHVHQQLGPEEFGFHEHEACREDFFKKMKPENRVKGRDVAIEFLRGTNLVCGVYDGPAEETYAHVLASRARDFLKRAAESDEPFFARVDFIAPHFPNVVPEPFASMYQPESIPPWPNFDETFEGKPAGHYRKHLEWNLQDKDWDWWKKVVAMYYGDVSSIDAACGKLLRTLEELGLDEDTVVMYATDHGDATGSHRHFEKAGTMYEEVFRIPLIIRWPGVTEPRSTNSDFARLLDLMPTILDAAGSPMPEEIDGRSLRGLCSGKTPKDWPRSTYCEFAGDVWGYCTQRMVRTKKFKYVYNPFDLDELYDLESDPHELKNLAYDASYAAELISMRALFHRWIIETKDMLTYSFVSRNFPEPAEEI